MGWLDFLKGIIPEKLINVNLDNRKIVINADSIQIGDNVINDSKIVDKLINKLGEYKDKESLPSQVIHKDLDKSYEEYEEISINQKASLNKLRGVLSEEDMECILMARRVKLAYDKQDISLAKNLQKQLHENYPEKGSKVYNLIGGEYFDEMIIPFIDIFKSRYDDEFIEKYREFYYDILRFFPLAFFVGNGTQEDKIIDAINDRLKLAVPFIRLHAIGDGNIKKVENVMEKLSIEDKYTIKDDRFTSAIGLKAQILEIKIAKNVKKVN